MVVNQPSSRELMQSEPSSISMAWGMYSRFRSNEQREGLEDERWSHMLWNWQAEDFHSPWTGIQGPRPIISIRSATL
jgi:hypothetical protein